MDMSTGSKRAVAVVALLGSVGLVCVQASPAGAGQPLVRNGAFEEADEHGAPLVWEPCVIGAAPEAVLDRVEFREGRSSLRIRADAPTDAAWQQHVELEPGR